MEDWQIFVLGVIAFQVLKMLALSVNQTVIEQRRKRVVRLVKVAFPDQTSITFSAVESSDKRAMDKIIKQLQEQGQLPDEEAAEQDGRSDRRRDGGVREDPYRDRQYP